MVERGFSDYASWFKQRMWIAESPDTLSSTLPQHSLAESKSVTEIPVGHTETPNDEEFSIMKLRFITCFAILCSAMALTGLDYSATGNIMAQIGQDLHGTTTQVEWIGNGYALASCVLQLPISALSDIFGRRALLMISLAFFFIGSVASATATNMHAMIAGRVIQGAGGAGCYVLPEVIVADTIPLRIRSQYYGIFMLDWAVFSGAAPMIAGAFAQYSTWRWFFYMNLFISGLAFIACPYAIKLKRQVGHDRPWYEKLRDIDVIGGLMLTASTVSLLLALSRGGSSSSLLWSRWVILLPLILGFLGLAATAVYEWRRRPLIPMFNIRVFCNTSASICYLHNILQGIVNLCSIYYLPSFFQGAKGYSPVVSGACILPLNLAGPPIVIGVGYLIARTGHYHFANLFMWALATVGMGIMTLYDGSRSIAALILLQIPASVGINCLYATLSTTANATNPPFLWTESTAMTSFFRAMGDTFGTAIGGAVLASQLRSRLTALSSQGLHVPDSSNVLVLVNSIRHIDSPELRQALINIFSRSIRMVFVVLTAFCGLSFLLTLFQKEYSLDRRGVSKQGIDR